MRFVTTKPGSDPIVVEGHFPVPPSAVFRAWTEPDQIKAWFGSTPGVLADASTDLRPGGRWRFTEANDEHGSIGFEGRYIDIVPNRRLVFSWTKFSPGPDGARQNTPESRVEITLEDDEGTTRMRIVHSLLDEETRRGFAAGWEAGTGNLADHVTEDAARGTVLQGVRPPVRPNERSAPRQKSP